VRYALGALKNVGEKAMEVLVAEREANGPYKSLDDFAARIDPRMLNRRQLESLAGAGAFDAFAPNRAAVHASAEIILAHAASAHDQRTSGQHGLFGGPADAGVAPIRLARDAHWSLAERMTAERAANGAFTSLDDFAARIDPKILNRRQLESLAAAGAFDELEPNRAAVHASAEIILAHAASAHDQRTSGQHGLFGGGGGTSDIAPIRLARDAHWSLAERMTAERDAFGFYFSAHPVDSQRHLLAAHKVKSFAELSAIRAPADGGRSQMMMAGMVESVRWRTSAKGRRYMLATISDPSGQYEATAFDDEPSAALEAAAKAGGCGLMTVELDRRPGEDTPRVTIKRFQPLDGLARKTRLQLTLSIPDASLIPLVARELLPGGTGTVHATLAIAGGEATLLLGRAFLLDADLAARLTRLLGEGAVELRAQEAPKLALVG
jgi:DNA polymerase-3 subunit alpha